MSQEKYDHDHAHSILIQCVIHDPGNPTYLEAFLENLHRKYKHNKRGAMLNFGGRGPFKKALAAADWGRVLKLGPELLRSNPWDVPVLRALAEACAEFGFGEVELRYLRNALDADPHDPQVNRHCARSLVRMGQFDQAIACWQRVDEARRGDAEAQRMISELQMAKTFGRPLEDTSRKGGGKRAGEAPRALETKPASPGTDTRREIKLTPRQELEQAIAHRPTDLDSYFALADLHIAEGRLAEAAHVLTRACAASGQDLKAIERLEDLEMLRKQEQVAIAEKRAAGGDTAAQELAARLANDLNRYELEVFHRRAERYPRDLEAKFQLGLRLKRAGNIRQAIPCFYETLKLPSRLTGALLELGECLQRTKQYEQALECYLRAVDRAVQSGQSELEKLARYRSGALAAGLHNHDEAERQFARLVELDPTYKDAAPRLDKIRQIRHNS